LFYVDQKTACAHINFNCQNHKWKILISCSPKYFI